MKHLPHHHDWPLLLDDHLRLQVHWFRRFAVTPEWRIDRTRLTAHMVAFIFIEDSTCTCTINGVVEKLAPGDLLIIQGGDEFEFSHNPRCPVTSLSACIALGRQSEPNILLQRRLPRRIRWPFPEDYRREFEQVLAVLPAVGAGRDLRVSGAVQMWLGYLLSHLKAPLISGAAALQGRSAVDKVLHAQRWADEQLGGTVMLEDWAASVGLNPVYFGRLFKQETGRSPMAWLNEQRLRRAASLLEQTAHPIQEIATLCGFNCPFYFSKAFRRRFRQSPQNYRKAQE
jgi:AraC-like DNA-binding protein